MRILHLGKYYPPASGGIEAHVRTLAKGQAAMGHTVRVLCVQHANNRHISVIGETFARTRESSETDGLVSVRRLGRVAHLARFDVVPGLRGELSRLMRSTDIVHLHTPNPLMLIACASLAAGPDMLVTHHSDAVKQKRLAMLVSPFEDRVYGRARVIFSDSPGYADGSATLKRHASRVRVLPLGIDLEPYEQPHAEVLRSANDLRQSYPGPLWLMVGRLVYYKGHAVAIDALAQIPGTLLMVGTGPLEASLRNQAASLGVANRVRWLGHASNDFIIAAYHAATALLFPSVARSEGFGLAQVEAMASGCPVINTNIPASGVSWVSQHDVSGLTVPVGDATALAAAGRALANDSELRNRLSMGARARARAEFDHRQMAQRWAKAVGA